MLEYLKDQFFTFCVFLADENEDMVLKILTVFAVCLIGFVGILVSMLLIAAIIASHGIVLVFLFVLYLALKTFHFIGRMKIREDEEANKEHEDD